MSQDAWLDARLNEQLKNIEQLLASAPIKMDDDLESTLRRTLPRAGKVPGIYVIKVQGKKPGEFLTAGQSNNLLRRALELKSATGKVVKYLDRDRGQYLAPEFDDAARDWIPGYCVLQILPMASVKDMTPVVWAERFMLAVLQPKYEFGIRWRSPIQDELEGALGVE